MYCLIVLFGLDSLWLFIWCLLWFSVYRFVVVPVVLRMLVLRVVMVYYCGRLLGWICLVAFVLV